MLYSGANVNESIGFVARGDSEQPPGSFSNSSGSSYR